MAISFTPVVIGTHTFSDWIAKTNLMANAFSTVVSTNSNTATGNAAITGTFGANRVNANTIATNSFVTNTANTITMSSNVTFTSNVALGNIGNISVNGANTSHKFLTVNPADQRLTPASLITEILAVDGDGSAIDADLLDGQQGSYYATMANMSGSLSNTQHGNMTNQSLHAAANATNHGFMTSTLFTKLNGFAANNYAVASAGLSAANVITAVDDADFIGVIDASDSNIFKKITWGNLVAGVNAVLALLAPKESPTFTGTPSAPTPAAGTNSTQLATTAFVASAVSPKANTASPTFTGTPTAPTQAFADNSTRLATTEYVQAKYALLSAGKANNDSPTFTGNPTAPTPGYNDNSGSLATTANVWAKYGVLDAIKANRAGGSFSGSISIDTSGSVNPRVTYTYAGQGSWSSTVGVGGSFYIWNEWLGDAGLSLDPSGNGWIRGYLQSVGWRDRQFGGMFRLMMGNNLDFTWNNGFFYRIDGNTWTLINSSASDENLKDNIEPLAPDSALETLAKIEPKTFEFKPNVPVHHTKGNHPGLIAQNLKDVLPSLVTDSKLPHTDEPFLRYSDDADKQLIALLIAAVNDLSARVKELEK